MAQVQQKCNLCREARRRRLCWANPYINALIFFFFFVLVPVTSGGSPQAPVLMAMASLDGWLKLQKEPSQFMWEARLEHQLISLNSLDITGTNKCSTMRYGTYILVFVKVMVMKKLWWVVGMEQLTLLTQIKTCYDSNSKIEYKLSSLVCYIMPNKLD